CLSTSSATRVFYSFFFYSSGPPRSLHSFPTRRSSDLVRVAYERGGFLASIRCRASSAAFFTLLRSTVTLSNDEPISLSSSAVSRSEEHTSELQSLAYLVCRLLLEKKNNSPPAIPSAPR